MEVIKIKGNKELNPIISKLKVAAYIRVSTESENQVNSFESQKMYFENKIAQNNNWTLVDIYSDLGISGISAVVRVQKDVRISGISLSSVGGDAVSLYEEYNVKNIYTSISLPNSNSSATYDVVVHNLGNVRADCGQKYYDDAISVNKKCCDFYFKLP